MCWNSSIIPAAAVRYSVYYALRAADKKRDCTLASCGLNANIGAHTEEQRRGELEKKERGKSCG